MNPLPIVLIGHGRMGRLIESLAPGHGCVVIATVTSRSGPRAIAESAFEEGSVAVDFSSGSAVLGNVEQLAGRGINVVIGTTGWQADEVACRRIAAEANIGVIAAANFSIGMSVFRMIVEEAARRFAGQADVGAWVHELHHAMKKDAPSGTALMLKSAMEGAGYTRPIDISSSRAGSVPGTHEVGFDALAETVTLTHTVRDRAVFAHGALEAARWISGRRGWYTIGDMTRGD